MTVRSRLTLAAGDHGLETPSTLREKRIYASSAGVPIVVDGRARGTCAGGLSCRGRGSRRQVPRPIGRQYWEQLPGLRRSLHCGPPTVVFASRTACSLTAASRLLRCSAATKASTCPEFTPTRLTRACRHIGFRPAIPICSLSMKRARCSQSDGSRSLLRFSNWANGMHYVDEVG